MVYFPLNSPFIFSNNYMKGDYNETTDNTSFVQRSSILNYVAGFDTFAFRSGQEVVWQVSVDKKEPIVGSIEIDGLPIKTSSLIFSGNAIDVHTFSFKIPVNANYMRACVCHDNTSYYSQEFKVIKSFNSEYQRFVAQDEGFQNGAFFGSGTKLVHDFLAKIEPPEIAPKILLSTFEDEIGGVTTTKRGLQREVKYKVLQCLDVICDRISIIILNKYLSINNVTGNLSSHEVNDTSSMAVKSLTFSLQVGNNYQLINGQDAPPISILAAEKTAAMSDNKNNLILI